MPALHLLIAPTLITLLSLPLYLEKVPRNPLYGFRTKDTMSSDAQWYRSNKAAGLGGIIGGILWFCVVMALPELGIQITYVTPIGLVFVLGAVVLAVKLTD